MTKIVISIALAYLLAGVSQVMEDLRATAFDKPHWARRPTFSKAMLFGATWIVRPFLNARRSNQLVRAVAFAFLSVALRFVVLTGLVWCCIIASAYLFDNVALQAVAVVVLLIIGTRVVMPWLNLLLTPLTLIVALPLDFLFPLKDKDDVQQIRWCKNCAHLRKLEQYEDIIHGLWRSESRPQNGDLPCSILPETSEVWERYFLSKPESRTLYPKDCPFFEWRA
jgi:hypothetical protein